MFNKYIGILLFFIFSSFIKYDHNYYYKEFNNEIHYEVIGGKVIINGNEITINFYGEVINPPKSANWEIHKENNYAILSYVNEEGVTFTQQWDFSNKSNPILTVNVSHPNKKLEIQTNILIKYAANNKSKILCNFKKFTSQISEFISTTIFDQQDGWVAIKDDSNVFAIHANEAECIVKKGEIHLRNTQNNTNITSSKYTFHSTPLSYNFINNNENFKNLDKCLEFGFLGSITHIMFKIINFLMYYIQNLYICLLLIALLLTLLIAPFLLESFKMHELIYEAEPEINVAQNLYSNNIETFNKEKDRIYSRYGISMFKQIFGQMLILVPMTVFNDIALNLKHFNLVPNLFGLSQYQTHIAILMILITVNVLYSYFTLYIKQLIIIVVMSFLYINYESLALIGLIVIYLMFMILGFIKRIFNNGKY